MNIMIRTYEVNGTQVNINDIKGHVVTYFDANFESKTYKFRNEKEAEAMYNKIILGVLAREFKAIQKVMK